MDSIDTFAGKLVCMGHHSTAQWCESVKADCVQCETLQLRIQFLEGKVRKLRNKEEECEVLKSRIEFLEEKVALLEDIALTSDIISAMSHSFLSNLSQDQTVLLNQCVEVGVQTDSQSESQSCTSLDIQIDGVQNVPESFLLLDSEGNVEAPASLLSDTNYQQELLSDQNYLQDQESLHANSLNVSSATTNSSNLFWGPRIRESNYYRELAVSPVSSCSEDEIPSNNLVCPEVISSTTRLIPEHIKPIEVIDDCPFSKFSANELLKELNFSHEFSNRLVSYFGKYPYNYSGGSHEPQDMPGGSYLDKLCCYLSVILPDFKYNSVLVNLYRNGRDFIPAHSDSKLCIADNSEILTVSLGASRDMAITESSTGSIVCSLSLNHGSLCAMSKESQSYFRHEILPNPSCSEQRVSLTFRLIKPDPSYEHVPTILTSAANRVQNTHPTDSNASGYVPYPSKSSTKENHSTSETAVQFNALPPKAPKDPTSALYISSSMFRYISAEKLSSGSIKACKLFYPGADVAEMLSKLKRDIPTLNINPVNIYIMTGTNNVDPIYYDKSSIGNVMRDIAELVEFIKFSYPNSNINIVNILPRASKGRNDIVVELNKMIEKYSSVSVNSINFMSSKHLFKYKNGSRNNLYFMPPNRYYDDNCHLNSTGITRLGKYLKFWSHEHLRS